MTVILNSNDVAQKIATALPESEAVAEKQTVIINSTALYTTAKFLKNEISLDFDYLSDLTSVDYIDYFEIIYNLSSLTHNHSTVLKTRCYGRENPTVSSVVSLWRAAYYQEREAYDLMGITFTGHPDLKRLFLWDGFQGHPLRRDYL